MGKLHPLHKCTQCDKVRLHSYRYDAYYCEICLIWLSDKCDNKECIFCSDRPEKPVFQINKPKELAKS